MMYLHKWYQLDSSLSKIRRLYSGGIADNKADDLASPAEVADSFFQTLYQLSEALQETEIEDLERFISMNPYVRLALDIATKDQPMEPSRRRNGWSWRIDSDFISHLQPLWPGSSDVQTVVTIRVEGEEKDVLKIAENAYTAWEEWLKEQGLI